MDGLAGDSHSSNETQCNRPPSTRLHRATFQEKRTSPKVEERQAGEMADSETRRCKKRQSHGNNGQAGNGLPDCEMPREVGSTCPITVTPPALWNKSNYVGELKALGFGTGGS